MEQDVTQWISEEIESEAIEPEMFLSYDMEEEKDEWSFFQEELNKQVHIQQVEEIFIVYEQGDESDKIETELQPQELVIESFEPSEIFCNEPQDNEDEDNEDKDNEDEDIITTTTVVTDLVVEDYYLDDSCPALEAFSEEEIEVLNAAIVQQEEEEEEEEEPKKTRKPRGRGKKTLPKQPLSITRKQKLQAKQEEKKQQREEKKRQLEEKKRQRKEKKEQRQGEEKKKSTTTAILLGNKIDTVEKFGRVQALCKYNVDPARFGKSNSTTFESVKLTKDQAHVCCLMHRCVYKNYTGNNIQSIRDIPDFDDERNTKKEFIAENFVMMPPGSKAAWDCYLMGCWDMSYVQRTSDAKERKQYLNNEFFLEHEKNPETLEAQRIALLKKAGIL